MIDKDLNRSLEETRRYLDNMPQSEIEDFISEMEEYYFEGPSVTEYLLRDWISNLESISVASFSTSTYETLFNSKGLPMQNLFDNSNIHGHYYQGYLDWYSDIVCVDKIPKKYVKNSNTKEKIKGEKEKAPLIFYICFN